MQTESIRVGGLSFGRMRMQQSKVTLSMWLSLIRSQATRLVCADVNYSLRFHSKVALHFTIIVL